MSLISVARNAARWLGVDLGRDDGHVAQAVVVIDPATGEAGAHGLTDAQLRATALPTTDSLGGTRAFNWSNNVREAFTTSSTAAIALPTLGASRELRIHTSVRAFIRFGAPDVSPATVAAGQMISPADAPDVIRIPTGQTHVRVIGETASGSISLTAVI